MFGAHGSIRQARERKVRIMVLMRMTLFVFLCGAGVCAGTVGIAEQAGIEPVVAESRTAAMRAFLNGDFMTYKKYLEAALAWHLKQMETQPFDREKIGNEIIRYSLQNCVKLTQDEFDQKLMEAKKLIQGFGGGWLSVHRDQVRQLYDSLALLCSVMSDAECEIKNRTLASRYE